MITPNHFSARETGITLAQGLAVADNFPMVTDPSRELVSSEIVRMIKDVGPEEFKLDRRFMPGVSDLALTAELIEVPDHGRTREENSHMLQFGQLLLHGEDEGEHSLHVAVKPFDLDSDAAREYAVASYIADGHVDSCETFRPLGVMRTTDGLPAVISLYRHSVRSMDGIFWNPDLVHATPIVSKALGRAGTSMALLHDDEWVHTDAQAKNVAWDVLRPFARTFLIDVESAEPVGHLGTDERHNLKLQDIDTFVGSLYRLEQAGETLPANYDDLIKEHFGLAYAGVRGNGANPNGSIDFAMICDVVDSGTRA